MNILLIALSLPFAFNIIECDKKSYQNHTVFRLLPKSVDQVKYLIQLTEEDNYDFWTSPRRINSTVDVMVAPKHLNQFKRRLALNNIKSDVLIPDLEKLLKEQESDYQTRKSKGYFDDYQRFDAVNAFVKQIATDNPSFASVTTIGKSSEGREMNMLRLGSGNNKYGIWIDGGIHAREWISPATVAYILQTLVDGYKSGDAEIKLLVDSFDWYFLLVVNPDGYEYTHTKDRMWRKTRSRRQESSCYGVDANRNYGYKWNNGGSSGNPCSDTYRGPKPFSEPETIAIRDAVTNLNKNKKIKLSLNFHSYSQLWLYPWGWTSDVTPDDAALAEKAKIAVNALSKVHGAKYDYGTSTNVLYIASGGSDDWAYGGAGIKYSYTVELRDTGYYGFTLPKSYIKPSGEETFAAVKALVQALQKEYP